MSDTTVQPITPVKPVPPPPVSWEEFLAWCDEDVRAEWVDGEIVLMNLPAEFAHQQIVLFLSRSMSEYVQVKQLGDVIVAPFLMRLPNRPSGREPDLMFVSADRTERIKRAHLDGPADLVVEVISADSDERDRSEKFREYAVAGIQEYWLIDPLQRTATFYHLTLEGRYREALVGPEGIYRCRALPGFRLRIDWLWQRYPPTPAQVRQELGF